jgi:hypothetical protein
MGPLNRSSGALAWQVAPVRGAGGHGLRRPTPLAVGSGRSEADGRRRRAGTRQWAVGRTTDASATQAELKRNARAARSRLGGALESGKLAKSGKPRKTVRNPRRAGMPQAIRGWMD